MNIEQVVGVAGYQNIQLLRDGKVVFETGFQKNMILDTWFDRVLTNGNSQTLELGASFCAVGTGTTAVNPTQTSLVSFLAIKAGNNGFDYGYDGLVDGVPTGWAERRFDFAQGAVVGNIAEVGTGMQFSPNSSTPLLTRALILDTNNNPTTISVTADDQLRIIHRIYTRWNPTPVTGSFQITSQGNTVTHNFDLRFIVRASDQPGRYSFVDISSRNYRDGSFMSSPTLCETLTHSNSFDSPTTNNTQSTGGMGISAFNFVKNGLTLTATAEIPVGVGNFAQGIGGMVFNQVLGCSYAISFSPRIPKTNLNKFRYTVSVTFARI